MTTFFQWRRFNFFDIAKDVDEGEMAESILKEQQAASSSSTSSSSSLTCTSSGRGHLILGDALGQLHFVNRHLKVHSMRVFQRKVYLIHQMRQSGLVVVVGEDDPGINPYLKIYNLDRPDKSGCPVLVRMSRLVLPGGRVSEPVSLSASENQTLLAIGFSNGVVLLQRGDLTRDRGIKQKVLLEESDQVSVTGLSFKLLGKAVYLFVSTAAAVYSFNVTVKDKEEKNCLDSLGCEQGLAITAENLSDAHFVTGRNDAVYCYTPESRGQCYAFDGRKVALHWFRNYLVVVSVEAPSSAAAAKMSPPAAAAGSEAPQKNLHVLTIFDVQNKFVAFTAPVKPIKALLSEWGLLFAITEDNRLFQLTEKDIQAKLELLFKKNFYDIAVKIAKSQQYDEDGLVDIFKQYGDHLYTKGDYSSAIDNYVKTIGHLEPSYVIRKFLDAHKIHHLTGYLQALHSKNLANEDHTTLLLNCYTKLKDKAKLDEFTAKDSVDFDVDIAIKVCRQAGYNKHALDLAKKHGRHEWYLCMQIEDVNDYADAVRYIGTLDFDDAELNMKKYGHSLMQKMPAETTQLLKILCTDYKPSNAPLISENMLDGGEDCRMCAKSDDYLHLFVNTPAKMIEFIEYMIEARPRESEGIYNTLLEHYMRQLMEMNDDEEAAATAATRRNLKERVMQVLKSEDAKYDIDLAMVHCTLYGFRKGLLFILEEKGLYSQILQHHVEAGDVAALVQTCRAFGLQNPNLWVEALRAVSQEGFVTQINEILEMVEKLNLLSYVQVLDVFQNAACSPIVVLRDYLLRSLATEQRLLSEDRTVIRQYAVDSHKLKETIETKKSENFIFQFTKCDACKHLVEMPAILFLCGHQYHKHCFESYSDKETECPVCQPENKKIMDIVHSQQKSREEHDSFHHQLETAENGFSVVAEYFSRGMFRQPIELAELSSQLREAAQLQEQQQHPHARAASISGNVAGPGAEARTRAREGAMAAAATASQRQNDMTEARLRAVDRSARKDQQSEARLRSQQTTEAAVGIPVADARLRQREGTAAGSLEANMTRTAPPRHQQHQSPRRSPHVVPRREDIQSRDPNPFGGAVTAGANPFGDDDELGENNPFAEAVADAASSNPFGAEDEDQDYNEGLNPFAAS